jgi:hypothetical protein
MERLLIFLGCVIVATYLHTHRRPDGEATTPALRGPTSAHWVGKKRS